MLTNQFSRWFLSSASRIFWRPNSSCLHEFMIHIFECWIYFSFLFNITLHLYTVIYDPRAYKVPTLLYFRFYSGFLSTPHHVKFLGMRSLCIRPYDNDLSNAPSSLILAAFRFPTLNCQLGQMWAVRLESAPPLLPARHAPATSDVDGQTKSSLLPSPCLDRSHILRGLQGCW
jgi:hypothetical protein